MAGIDTLVDDFNDNSINGVLWPGNYGGVAETGGQFVIDCDVAQWSGLKSATDYTLDESQVSIRAHPPAANTATVAYLSVLVTTTVAGTDAGFNIDTASGGIAYLVRAGFSDAGAVFGTYSPTDHAYLRLRETTGSLLWETSADGQSWTVRRTSASPAWVADTTLALVCESHRDAGTDNTAAVDDVNVISVSAGPLVLQAVAGLPAVTASASSTATPAAVPLSGAAPQVGLSAGAVVPATVVSLLSALPVVVLSAGSAPTPATVAAVGAWPTTTATAVGNDVNATTVTTVAAGRTSSVLVSARRSSSATVSGG